MILFERVVSRPTGAASRQKKKISFLPTVKLMAAKHITIGVIRRGYASHDDGASPETVVM